MKRMTKEAEDNILRGVEQIVDLVQDGWNPNDAVVKVASDGDYQAGHVRLMCQAYNTGRTNHQRKSTADLLEKTAVFPLADAAVALETLYPTNVKTAAAIHRSIGVSDDYGRPPDLFAKPTMEKAAFAQPEVRAPALPRDPGYFVKRASIALDMLEREQQQKRAEKAALLNKLDSHLDTLDNYFRLASPEVSFVTAAKNAALLWGAPAMSVLDKVARANPKVLVKQAAAQGPVNHSREPYVSIAAAIKLAADYQAKEAEIAEFDKEASDKSGQLREAMVSTVKISSKKTINSILKEAQPQTLGLGQANQNQGQTLGMGNAQQGQGMMNQRSCQPSPNRNLELALGLVR